MLDIKIRSAELADLEVLRRFEQGVVDAERPFNEQLKEGEIQYYDLENMFSDSNTEILVAEIDSTVIASGYSTIRKAKPFFKHDRYAYLGFMYVEPNYRGKGVIKMVLDELIAWSAKNDAEEIRLEVYSDNLPAIKAYRKAGFKELMTEMRMPL